MDDKTILNKLISSVKEDSIRALGCTEPVAIAYTAYEAGMRIKDDKIKKLTVSTSKSIYKNAKSVKIPNTNGRHGIGLAGAIGLFSKDLDIAPSLIFESLTEENLEKSLKLVDDGLVEVKYLENTPIPL